MSIGNWIGSLVRRALGPRAGEEVGMATTEDWAASANG